MRMLILFLLLACSVVAQARMINFTWDIPNEREDGTTLFTNEISGYTIYENGIKVMFVEGGATAEALYDYDAYGQPCFTISTTDAWQQEGSQSAEVCINVFPAPPEAPALHVSL